MLVGICLDRGAGGNTYTPKFHVHFLGTHADTVSLTLYKQLISERSGGPDFVQVRFHKEKYKDAAARMVRQAPLPLLGDVHFDQVIELYEQRVAEKCGESPVLLYQDMILLSAWADQPSDASRLLSKCLRLPDSAGFHHVGGRDSFAAKCARQIQQPALVRQTVDSEIVALRVGRLPVSALRR